MSLGACRLNRCMVVSVAALWASLNLSSCGSSKSPGTPASGLTDRVLVSQSVTSTSAFGSLVIINGFNDTVAPVPRLGAGNSPGLMAISPARNIVAAFDSGSNSVFSVNTVKESSLGGQVRLPGATASISVPTSSPVGYAAVPTATVSGFNVLGAVEVMNLTSGSISTTIPVTNAQTLVANQDGSQLVVFSNDSDSVTLLAPSRALPGIDASCFTTTTSNICTIIPGFDRPVYAVINGTTAYILNCGAECGGTQASVQTLDLVTNAMGTPVPVNGATYAFLSGTNLYVAGDGTPSGPLCASIPNAAQTAATHCGTLDIVDLATMTDTTITSPIAIPDGYHDRMDMSINGQLFIGSRDCTNVGDVNNPAGEVRGCLAILNTTTGAVIYPPDNGNVDGLQSFNTRLVEYVAEGGNLRVYDTTQDILLINEFIPLGTITVVGYVDDVKAIDFF